MKQNRTLQTSRTGLCRNKVCVGCFFRNPKGTATVEAAIILPFVILAFVSILSVIRITATYERMQHALNQVAEDLSQYSYLYAVSGLKEKHDVVIDNIDEAKNSLVNRQNAVSTFYDSIQSLAGDMSPVGIKDESTVTMLFDVVQDVQETKASFEELTQHIEEILSDPMGELQMIGLALSDTLLSRTKTELFSLITKSMLKGRLSKDLSIPRRELDERLRFREGIEELDFSGSTFFDDRETIDLVLEYTVKPMPDFILLPEIRLRNRACVLAWAWGVEKEKDGSGEEDEFISLWDIEKNKDPRSQHMKRGLEIEKRFARELVGTLRENTCITPLFFPTVDAIEFARDNKKGTVYAMTSLNPFLNSYQTQSGISNNIKKHIDKLYQFERGETKDCSIDISKNLKAYQKKAYVIVPENDPLPEIFFKAFEEGRTYAGNYGIELEYVKRYGAYTDAEENESEK